MISGRTQTDTQLCGGPPGGGFAAALLSSLCACASGGAQLEAKPAVEAASLDVAPARLAGDAKLKAKLKKSAHNYLRFIAQPFSQAVCARYPALVDAPAVNLHGDAHLEQYAVTEAGFGLTDFDEATSGPAAIDLLHFGVSLQLVAEQLGQPKLGAKLNTRFLGGYERGLRDGAVPAQPPAIAQALRAKFKHDPRGHLEWVSGLMKPLPSEEQAALEAGFSVYAANMRALQPALPAGYFEVKSMGGLKMGIGSARSEKYLLRVEGDSADPLDDVIIEAKAVEQISGVSCVLLGTTRADPLRVLLGETRIAYQPYKLLGTMRVGDGAFWVHAWRREYKELDLDDLSAEEAPLLELVYDIGRQLGRGHINQIDAPLSELARRRQLNFLHRNAAALEEARVELAEEVKRAYARFVAAD